MRSLALLHALVAYNGVFAAPKATIVEEKHIDDRQFFSDPVVKISNPSASIQGVAEPYMNTDPIAAGVLESFRQIPFAQPPVGPLRLKPPMPLDSSRDMGTIDATSSYAAACPQQIMDSQVDVPALPDIANSALNYVLESSLLNNSYIGGTEDCLTLNVQRPGGTKAGDDLPVVLWIFGGGFALGSTIMYDGANVVEKSVELGKPVIVVAVNYRVAAFGFLGGRELLADGSTNLGLLDQRLAMQWVQDHIRDFGGDPSKVTLWGQSAGSISIFNQIIAKNGNITGNSGAPLFHGAIMSSGSAVPVDPVDCPKAQTVYDTVVANAGCANKPDTLECLRSVPFDVFLNASNTAPTLLSYRALALSYIPRPDGTFIEGSPEALVTSGTYARVPFILGDQEDEGTLFALFTSNLTTTQDLVDYFREYYFNDPAADVDTFVSLYPDDPAAGSPFRTGQDNVLYPQFKRIAAILGDAVFTLTRRIVLNVTTTRNPDVPTWSYLASYDYGLEYLGTLHGTDLTLVYHGTTDDYASTAVLSYFLNFAYNLDPNDGTGGTEPGSLTSAVPVLIEWPQWGEGKTLVQFNENNFTHIQDDFRQDAYEFIQANAATLHY